MVFEDPRPDDEWYISFYRELYWDIYGSGGGAASEQATSRERYHQILRKINLRLDSTHRILDYGSGSGGGLVALRDVFPGSSVLGADASSDARAIGEFLNCDMIAIDENDGTLVNTTGKRFDCCLMVHVLEHTLAPSNILESVHKNLNSSGILYVEVPDILSNKWDGEAFIHIGHPLNFSAHPLLRLLESTGFSIRKVFHGIVRQWPWGIGVLCSATRTEPTDRQMHPEMPSSDKITKQIRRRLSTPGLRSYSRALPFKKLIWEGFQPPPDNT